MLTSNLFSQHTHLRIYKTIIKLIFMYGVETLILCNKEENKLITFVNIVLQKIFEQTRKENIRRIIQSWEIRELLRKPGVMGS